MLWLPQRKGQQFRALWQHRAGPERPISQVVLSFLVFLQFPGVLFVFLFFPEFSEVFSGFLGFYKFSQVSTSSARKFQSEPESSKGRETEGNFKDIRGWTRAYPCSKHGRREPGFQSESRFERSVFDKLVRMLFIRVSLSSAVELSSEALPAGRSRARAAISPAPAKRSKLEWPFRASLRVPARQIAVFSSFHGFLMFLLSFHGFSSLSAFSSLFIFLAESQRGSDRFQSEATAANSDIIFWFAVVVYEVLDAFRVCEGRGRNGGT